MSDWFCLFFFCFFVFQFYLFIYIFFFFKSRNQKIPKKQKIRLFSFLIFHFIKKYLNQQQLHIINNNQIKIMEDININNNNNSKRQLLLQEERKYSTKMIINLSTIYAHFNLIHNHIENNINRYIVNNIRYDAKQMKDTNNDNNVVYNFELMDGGDITYFNLLLELHKNLLDDSDANLSRRLSDFKNRIILTDINFIILYYDIKLFIDIYLSKLIISLETRSRLDIENIITNRKLRDSQSIRFKSLILSFQNDMTKIVNTLKQSIDVFTSVYNELLNSNNNKVKNMYFNLNLITIKIGEFIVSYKDLITKFINNDIKSEYTSHKQRIELKQQQQQQQQSENVMTVKQQQQKQKTIKELTMERKAPRELDVNLFKK